MAGDGVSMPTQLAQIGNVAKSQAQAQQAGHATTTFSEQLEKKDELKAQRIRESQKAEEEKINPDEDRRRQRKRRRRQKKLLRNLEELELAEDGTGHDPEAGAEEEIGHLVDLRA